MIHQSRSERFTEPGQFFTRPDGKTVLPRRSDPWPKGQPDRDATLIYEFRGGYVNFHSDHNSGCSLRVRMAASAISAMETTG